MPRAHSLWYKDAVIYEVHVKSFFDSDNDGHGDFTGLIEKLDYLQNLGITAIWLLPFYPSPLRDDGYDIANYRGVHPRYGTLGDFRRFVREAHRRGLRVITELVINHTSDQHPWFQAARRARPGSARRDFYVWSDTDTRFPETRIIFSDTEKSNWTWDQESGAYYWHRFFSHQPDLNHNNPNVVRAVIRILRYWLNMGVDGLRLDAVPYLCVRDGTNNENLPETHAVIKEIRRQIDHHHADRLLLAEANQWPEDVRPYFGDGDECHMAFHFPLMPRIFMALRQEDRHPIVEIMSSTPEIPATCQWGIFLRNHDELTLEMVTDEERDYMYREYASDPRMRLNLGIRRRLSPLVQGSRRRLELLNSLLFSFPGTPIIYYGDEIGMGDNIYLGDRDGVRTPMQWSIDRNAGFSRADPGQLYLPVIMDPVYGYTAVNVEAQERNPSSLLHFMRRMLSIRRQYKAFGRGTIEFLHPENRKVLVYIRRYRREVILAVANLSRFVQPVELDLSAFTGWTPVEMMGRTEFPTIGELPYFLTLGPHAFFWFLLEPRAEPIRIASTREAPEVALPPIDAEQGIGSIFARDGLRQLEETVLPVYVPRQRWFRAKAHAISAVRVVDAIKIGARFFIIWVDITTDGGRTQRYLIPLKGALGDEAQEIARAIPESLVAWVRSPKGEGVLFDALADEVAVRQLVAAMADGRRLESDSGAQLHAFTTRAYIEEKDFAELRPSGGGAKGVRRLGVEQSNTSVVVDEEFILKFFRVIEAGPNPDLEIGLHLTERTAFRNFPRVAGAIDYRERGQEPATVAMLQWFVPNQGDGWAYSLHVLQRMYEEVGAGEITMVPEAAPEPLVPWTADLPEEVQPLVGSFARAAEQLGRRTGEFHVALAQEARDRRFRPEAAGEAWRAAFAADSRRRAGEVLELLRGRVGTLPQEVRSEAIALGDAGPDGVAMLSPDIPPGGGGRLIRGHGDYHLGQVLRVEDDFLLLDFEGEPLRSLEERRRKQPPLRDVAGMLRSFDYAAQTALRRFARDHPGAAERAAQTARVWESWAAAVFLGSYYQTDGIAALLPAEEETRARMLAALMLDKAFYELEYELNNRPTWVDVPIRGLLRLLQETMDG